MKIRIFKHRYNNQAIHGIEEEKRPWILSQEIKKTAGTRKVLLDLGCGDAKKIIPLAPFFESIYLLDPSPDMISCASMNVKANKATNMCVITGFDEQLPFKDNSIDVITSIMSAWHTPEMFRVLKPEGRFIIETIVARDKVNIKKEFGKDEKGWRGQRLNHSEKALIALRKNDVKQFFNQIRCTVGYWNTYYTKEGLIDLLEATPIIRNYEFNKDKSVIDRIIKKYQTNKGIKTTQNRLLITGIK